MKESDDRRSVAVRAYSRFELVVSSSVLARDSSMSIVSGLGCICSSRRTEVVGYGV